MNLLKVKTWTWHSHLTEPAYLDVSKASSSLRCFSNNKAKNKEHFLLCLFQFCSGVWGLGSQDREPSLKVVVKELREGNTSQGWTGPCTHVLGHSKNAAWHQYGYLNISRWMKITLSPLWAEVSLNLAEMMGLERLRPDGRMSPATSEAKRQER